MVRGRLTICRASSSIPFPLLAFALFSGGLDSALGLAQDLRSSDAVAVSVHTNNRMKAAQRQIVRGLDGGVSTSCVQLQYRVSLREPGRENSQRTRGLLFLAAGIATAWALGQDRLRIYENGIGAINLPYLRSQEGSQATRSMHPRTLRMAEDLASAVCGRSFQVEAPYLLLTKAEAVRAVPEMTASVIAAAVSCDTAFAAEGGRSSAVRYVHLVPAETPGPHRGRA